MKNIVLIAISEWRYWLRSHLALSGALIFFALIAATTLLTAARMDSELHSRTHQQTEAEETFLGQPDRHPHRMVHYGHYLFRTPSPLAVFDPGLDAVAGQSIFLEGHRQNTVMFSESAASADLGGLSWLNPALIYQLFAPLVIVLLGHGSIVRERENAVLVPLITLGVNGRTLLCGKALALLSFMGVLLVPLLGSGLIAYTNGESVSALLSLTVTYGIYLAIWGALTLIVSTMLEKRSTALAVMTGLWLGLSLVLPSIAVNVVTDRDPVVGKIETDLAMLEDLRKLGDGHNANDPAFLKMRADLLEENGVDDVKDLPVNFRGLVAIEAEKKLTQVLNSYASSRMAAELRQERGLSNFGWLTPTLAVALASRSLSGTDLIHYQRFQAEAEAVRFEFVQGLNNAHAQKLTYQDDINRNKDNESWQRARVDSSNWKVLAEYQFQTANGSQRIENANTTIRVLLVWLMVSCGALLWCGGRLRA